MVDAVRAVDEILLQACRERASDVHVEPVANGYEVRYRVDGLLRTVRQFDHPAGRSIVTRLMVMAQLLTYRLDVPQEGRLTAVVDGLDRPLELRLAIMPITHGLRAALRLPADLHAINTLDALGLPPMVLSGLEAFAGGESGMLLLCGPAGSGKTTTIYALLERIGRQSPGVSIISLEDPVERDLPGVTQIEVSPFGELTYERALRSMLRQDPQVLMIGEIRDEQTASLAIQAALSGHRLISTVHSADAAGAVARLLEMGIAPYQVSNALFGIVSQRLLRRRADDGMYRGRIPVAEFVKFDDALRRALIERADSSTLRQIYSRQKDFVAMSDVAAKLVESGETDRAEASRVLGLSI